MASALALQRVQEAVRRTSGCVISSAIEACTIPNMGIGVVARAPIAKDTLVFQAGTDAWYPFSAECALEHAQRKAPGFLGQLQQLLTSNPALSASPFVPNALVLSAHLLVNFPRSPLPEVVFANVTDTRMEELYVNALPSYVELPFYWDESQLQHLEGCREAARSIQQSSKFYAAIHQHLFGASSGVVDRDAFFWAVSILMSRATSGTDQPFTLIPFFDWFNHSESGDECEHAFDPQRGFTVHTTRAYEAGEQLFINYGHHTNLRLLRNYGFTLRTNVRDTVELPLPPALQQLDPSDAMLNEKHELLRSLRLGDHSRGGSPVSKRTIQVAHDGQLAVASHQWLQVLLASRDELASLFHQASASSSTASPQQAASPVLELPESLRHKIRHHVRATCHDRLLTHRTPLEDDETFLLANEAQLAPWLRSCLHIRTSEKRALQRAMQRC